MNLMRFVSLVQFEGNLNYCWHINIQKLWRNISQLPYHVEYTGSRLITKVKEHWAWVVLGWETTWEHQVLLAFVMEKFIWNFVFDWFSLWFALKSLNKCYFRSSTKTAEFAIELPYDLHQSELICFYTKKLFFEEKFPNFPTFSFCREACWLF